MPIDTLDEVKAVLKVSGTTDDGLLNRLLVAAESFIHEHCGRAFPGGSYTETHPAGGALVFLKHFPVEAVASVRVDANRVFGTDAIRPATDYLLYPDRGVIASLTGPFLCPRPGRGPDDWPGSVQVAYTTFDDQVPGAVKQAFALLVGLWYREAKTNSDAAFRMLVEEETGTGRKAWSWGLTAGLNLPPEVLRLLEPFRVPPV
ncbi:MAG: head-tail connector protein [Gemmataceae bacterium]|nr:head-tail connector protein [Gemmataceae bacterium]